MRALLRVCTRLYYLCVVYQERLKILAAHVLTHQKLRHRSTRHNRKISTEQHPIKARKIPINLQGMLVTELSHPYHLTARSNKLLLLLSRHGQHFKLGGGRRLRITGESSQRIVAAASPSHLLTDFGRGLPRSTQATISGTSVFSICSRSQRNRAFSIIFAVMCKIHTQ